MALKKLDLLEDKVECQTALINKLTTKVNEQNELLKAIDQKLAKTNNNSISAQQEEETNTAVLPTFTSDSNELQSPVLTPQSELVTQFRLFNLTSENDVNHTDTATKNEDDVYFCAQMNSGYLSRGTVIPFEEEVANVGGAMDLASGVFTAPRNGSYFFSFSAVAGGTGTVVYLDVNGTEKGIAFANNLQSLSLEAIVKLKEGD